MGQLRDEIRPGLRCFVVSPYIFIFYYRLAGTTIQVVRMLHGARDVSAIVVPED